MIGRLTAATAATFYLATAGHAAAVDPVAMLSSFSVISLGDHTLDSDMPSPLYVGGNLTVVGNHSINNNNNLPDGSVGDATGALIVGGTFSGASNIKGNVALGGDQGVTQANSNQLRFLLDNGSEFNLNKVGTTVADGHGIPAADVQSAFEDLSSSWAELSERGSYTLETAGNPKLTVGAGTFAVIDFDESEFATFLGGDPSITFAGSPLTTIINVAGSSIDLTRNLNKFTGGNNVIFNFHEATQVNVNATFEASILAPFAHINALNGGADAFMVGSSIFQKIEIRKPFDGTVPTPDPGVVPLPAAGWLLVAGIAGLGVMGRRRAV